MIIAHLPPQSNTKTAVRDAMTPEQVAERAAEMPEQDGHGPWSHTDLLLAAIADAAHVLVWQQTQIHGGTKSSAPEPIRRPGATPKSGGQVSAAGVTYLNEIRMRRRRERVDPGR